MTTALTPPGRGGEVVAELGSRAQVRDLYDAAGAPVYHQLAAGNTLEVRELLRVVRRCPGPVLELAAGSGRLTFPLLALGREVVALELAPAMRQLLAEQLAAAAPALRQRCTVTAGDMADFSLGRTFGAVVLGTSSVSLLDEASRQGMFTCVREHLAPGGRLLMTTVDIDAAAVADAAAEDLDLQVPAGDGAPGLHIIEHWSAGHRSRTVTVLPAQLPPDGPVTVCVSTIRVLPPAQLAEEMAAAGLRVRDTVPVRSGLQRHTDVLLEVEVAP